MEKIVGVTELRRRFKALFDEVVKQGIPLILTRGSRPEAVLLPYEDFLRYREQEEREVLARFDRVWQRLAEQSAAYTEDEVQADVEAARRALPQESEA